MRMPWCSAACTLGNDGLVAGVGAGQYLPVCRIVFEVIRRGYRSQGSEATSVHIFIQVPGMNLHLTEIVLHGEHHDDEDHHRRQAQVLAGVHALRPE